MPQLNRKLAGWALLLCSCAAAQTTPPLTTIQDTLYKADGTRFNGVAEITWPGFTASNGSNIAMHAVTEQIVNGLLKVKLVPTANAATPADYTVRYNSDGKVQFTETWNVPASATPLRVQDVRIATTSPIVMPPADAQISITAVTGLTQELTLRPSTGTAFTPGRTAIINSAGAIDGAQGNPSDCMHVDGTSATCASSNFVDDETPAGNVDGVNTTFVLAGAPSPASSLSVFRNGLRMKNGVDYTVSGNQITFLAASTPQPGDVVDCAYRD